MKTISLVKTKAALILKLAVVFFLDTFALSKLNTASFKIKVAFVLTNEIVKFQIRIQKYFFHSVHGVCWL